MDQNKEKARRRLRRSRHIRKSIFGTSERPRLTVTRSLNHIYCQAVDDARGVTILSASSRAKEIRDEVGENAGNRKGAELVGRLLAQRAKDAGVRKMTLDRNGYKYHGRIAALTAAVRKEGIEV